jgi:hypothetical protein
MTGQYLAPGFLPTGKRSNIRPPELCRPEFRPPKLCPPELPPARPKPDRADIPASLNNAEPAAQAGATNRNAG